MIVFGTKTKGFENVSKLRNVYEHSTINIVAYRSVIYNQDMIRSKIKPELRKDFYQSKYEYYKKVATYCAYLIGLLEVTYFVSDCMLFGRFAYETVIPILDQDLKKSRAFSRQCPQPDEILHRKPALRKFSDREYRTV